jgi:hypothetical protein
MCIVYQNVEKYGTAGQTTDDNIIRYMRFACWVTKATETHSECVTLIAFPRQQRLRERASALSYTYTACVFNVNFVLLEDNAEKYSTKTFLITPA